MNIFCRDTAGRYLFANKAFAREAGLQQPSDLVGKTDAEMPWGDQFREEDVRLLAEGKPLLHQQWHCHSGANTNWMEIHKVPLYDEQGNPLPSLPWSAPSISARSWSKPSASSNCCSAACWMPSRILFASKITRACSSTAIRLFSTSWA